MDADAITSTDGFTLGAPALVCRWRLAGRHVVAEGRHLRALAARRVNGERLSPELLAWVRQHLEWTLESGATASPDGVLMLIVDEHGQAAMTVGPYEPLPADTLPDLYLRAREARKEGEETGVAPETMWFVRKNDLVYDRAAGVPSSGAASLVEDLARTLGIPVKRQPGACDAAQKGILPFDEVFLVSDEHGIVPAKGYEGARSKRFKEGYEKLCNTVRRR